MAKEKLTQKKAENSPSGGVVVGKRNGQTMIYDDASVGGYFVGKTHSKGGIKMINKSNGQPLEVQGSEVIITAPAVNDNTKREFEGKMMTNRQILSKINSDGGGVSFAEGGDVPKNIKRTGASYKYGGKTMTDHEIYKHITGGHLAEGMTLSQIAKMHKVSVKELQKQVDLGMKAESEHTSSKREQMKIVKDHLYENPKYYTLLKKAGLEGGGGVEKWKKITEYNLIPALGITEEYKSYVNKNAKIYYSKIDREWLLEINNKIIKGYPTLAVAKKRAEMMLLDSFKNGGSLVRDAKKGNTPARDLNNYNDVMDLEADGMVGADSGLFADGGSVKPYDANMEGDSADMVYARGGATNVIVNEWNEIPDSFKNVRLPKKVDWSAYPSNDGLYEIVKPFLSTEASREALSGINFDDNGITVTNAHILLTIPTDDHDFQGVYKKVKGDDGFTKLDVNYPIYSRIIPNEQDAILNFYVDIEKLLTYCKIASNYSGSQEVVFKINDEQMSFFPDLMIEFLSSLIKLTGRLSLNVSFTTNKKALVFSKYPAYVLGKDEIGLIMPYVYGTGLKLGARNESKKAELNVYFDFDDNEIRNSDGSIVTDWEEKPKKERAKRTPKTTPSKTSKPIDLMNKKIWVHNNPDLSRRVQELGFANGFVNSGGKTAVNTLYGNIYFTTKADGTKYMYILDYDKDAFDKQEEVEVFESDLFPTTSTPTSTPASTGKTIDLTNTKIWIGDNTELSRMVQKRAFELGWTLFGKKDVGRTEEPALYFTDDKKIGWFDDKKDFDYYPVFKEIFASDLFLTAPTPTKETEKIQVFRLVGLSAGYSIYGATELLEDYKVIKNELTQRELFPYRIYDINGVEHDGLYFGRGIETISDLTVAIVNSPIYDNYDWTEFFAYGTKEDEKPVEQPKPSKTDKPKRNFELERKYLSQRISDLAKELDLKRPILSNEEVAFYQREINSFILKLRKLNDAEMSLKSIEERVRGVYDLKISSFDSQYPETDMTSINALKSQLTEKEYFNVRTPEFKSFFGDWETAYLNDSYAGVSKVINPITKEPQPVFHGTNVLFVDWKTYETNNAHYFAVKREFSEFFATTWEERTDKAGVDSEILKRLNPNRGNFLLRCFIDVKNPIDFSRFGVDKYPIREYLTFLRVNYNIGDFDFWTNITSHSGITQDTEVYAWQIIRLWQSFTKYVKVFTTYDGYIFYEYIPTKPYGGLENASLSYCAFDSNQIKFTDAYEFNALSNDSRFDLGGIL